MKKKKSFNKVTPMQTIFAILALILACYFEASYDFICSLSPPSMTQNMILIDTIGILLVGFILGFPITMLMWNKLLAPIFNIPKINYIQALVLISALYWIKGL
jgi:hypothetical protein